MSSCSEGSTHVHAQYKQYRMITAGSSPGGMKREAVFLRKSDLAPVTAKLAGLPEVKRIKDEGDGQGRHLYCAVCRAFITSEGERIAMNGSHEHRFANVSGISFHIGCFRKAGGCLSLGAPSFEWTWFPGYAWDIAICTGCSTHLGWQYVCATFNNSFYGLILKHLVTGQDT